MPWLKSVLRLRASHTQFHHANVTDADPTTVTIFRDLSNPQTILNTTGSFGISTSSLFSYGRLPTDKVLGGNDIFPFIAWHRRSRISGPQLDDRVDTVTPGITGKLSLDTNMFSREALDPYWGVVLNVTAEHTWDYVSNTKLGRLQLDVQNVFQWIESPYGRLALIGARIGGSWATGN